MSAEKCNICGVSGTSTYRCCGNNKDFRIKQIQKQIMIIDVQIHDLEYKKLELYSELDNLQLEE
jgi:hypothetical protein